MTPAGEVLRDEICRGGPIPFSRFTEVALYHPQCGYYRRRRDPFGREGDFYTAEQVQPVFGILIAARIRSMWRAMGEPGEFRVVEPGAGRREMAAAFAEWSYAPLDIDAGELPEHFTGVAFSNEFFDALPVDVVRWRGGAAREMRVAWHGDGFVWREEEAAPAAAAPYIRRFFGEPREGSIYELNLAALDWVDRLARSLARGYVFTIDYGYTAREYARFPEGTLMSYRRHAALEDVLAGPGERDITAHVNFTALEKAGAESGLVSEGLQTLAQTLLQAGEADHFASVLGGVDAAEETRRRLQLKTLLFGMGETFRVLIQRKEGNRK